MSNLKLNKIFDDFNLIKRALEYQALLKDLDERRGELDRESALFVPLKQRLERGRKALELGEDYEIIKDLRASGESNKLKQASLKEDLISARADLQSAEEAFTLSEIEYRDKLVEQSKLKNIVIKVKSLDQQLAERRESVIQLKSKFEEAEKKLKSCVSNVEKKQISLEKIELSLRGARQFLQVHSIDEKLISGLDGIKKCFSLYEEAEEKRAALKNSWNSAILKKQKAQNVLNDRASLLNDVTQRYSIIEKNYARAEAFYESSLKGKSLKEWRNICEKNTKKLAGLDELNKKFHEEKSLREKLKILQEQRLRMQQETRNLNLRDVEQSGKIHELQDEVNKLERRVALLHRIEDLDAVRELLQDGIACPLCGSLTHPYSSGSAIPDPDEVHNQLLEAQKALDNFRDELTSRQNKTGRIIEDMSSLTREESETKNNLNDLSEKISYEVADLGLRIGAGISPFEEIDRARQNIKDQIQLAKNTVDVIEAAERDLKSASNEFENIKQSKEELLKFRQEALFLLQSERTEEGRFETESKTQEEITASLKRELISYLMPYGYKNLPDKNPEKIIEALSKRLSDWQQGIIKRNDFERELSVHQNEMAALKKERDNLKVQREELLSRLKVSEAERDSIQQQRIIIFASRNPDSEIERINRNVENLRKQLDEKNIIKNSCSLKLEKIMTEIHGVETEMSAGRDQLQRYEINFGKKMLALGFKSEDDYISSCLSSDERRELQKRLKELTQADIDLASERENVRAKLVEIQGGFNPETIKRKISELKKNLDIEISECRKNNDIENLNSYNEIFEKKLKPEIQNLALKCGLNDPFRE